MPIHNRLAHIPRYQALMAAARALLEQRPDDAHDASARRETLAMRSMHHGSAEPGLRLSTAAVPFWPGARG